MNFSPKVILILTNYTKNKRFKNHFITYEIDNNLKKHAKLNKINFDDDEKVVRD